MSIIETLKKTQKDVKISPLKDIFGTTIFESTEGVISDNEKLFSQAKKSIRIVSGILNHEYYNDERIVDSLKKAIDGGVMVEIISGPKEIIDKESKEILDLYKQGKITIWTLSSRPELHFSVVDEKHVRLENYHDLYNEGNATTIIERYPIVTAAKQTREFMRLKQNAKPLQFSEVT